MIRSRSGKSRHMLRAGLAAVCAAAVLAGCGGSSEEPNLPPPDEKKAEIAKARAELKKAKRQARQREAAAERRAEKATANAGGQLDAFLATLPGRAGLAAGGTGDAGPSVAGGDLTVGSAWSTIKVPIAQRVLRDAGGPDGLTGEQRSQITAALTLSDNDAAAALFSSLEAGHGGLAGASKAVQEELARAGDTGTVVSTQGRDSFSTYGQTEWPLSEQYRYMAQLAAGCLSPAADTGFLLDQMSNVTSDGWGIGSVGLPAKWKGGWGPGTDGKYLVRQMGVIETGAGPMALTLAAIPDDGSFETGQSMASQIAAWAVENLGDEVPASGGC